MRRARISRVGKGRTRPISTSCCATEAAATARRSRRSGRFVIGWHSILTWELPFGLGLSSNSQEKRGQPFTPEDGMRFLSDLEVARDRAKTTFDRAREYVTNTPSTVDTPVRQAVRERGWRDAQLSSTLFELTSPCASTPARQPCHSRRRTRPRLMQGTNRISVSQSMRGRPYQFRKGARPQDSNL